MAEGGGYLKAADALLVHLKKDPLFKITIPSKTQAYMAVGRPLLMAVDGDAADLVRESGCGVVVESENVDSLVSGVEKLLDSTAEELALMSKQGRDFYRKHLSLDQGILKFSRAFNLLAKK